MNRLLIAALTVFALVLAPATTASASPHGGATAERQEAWDAARDSGTTPVNPPEEEPSWQSAVTIAALGVLCLLVCWN